MSTPGTSLQTSRGSYYSQRGGRGQRQRMVKTSGGRAAMQQGRTVAYRTAGGQQVAGQLPERPGLPSRTWHRVILAEFVVTILIIGASPILLPRKQTAGGDAAAATLTFAGPLVRLTAACILFFVLALLGTGERSGKIAAAFGGLVVCGALLNATDMITELGRAVGAISPKAAAAPSVSNTAATGPNNAGSAPTLTGA